MSQRKQKSVEQALVTKLVPLMEGPATAKELSLTTVQAVRLKQDGVLKTVEVIRTGRAGRPEHKLGLTKLYRDRLRRRIKSGKVAVAA